jgi:hypothetical protein
MESLSYRMTSVTNIRKYIVTVSVNTKEWTRYKSSVKSAKVS